MSARLPFIGVIFSLFHLYTAGVQELPAMQQRLVHLTLGLMMAFLVFSPCRRQMVRKTADR